MTGLNSLAYSASHAQKDAILSLAKDGGGRGEGRGGEVRAGPGMPALPPRGDTGVLAKGGGLYRTAEITNRAQDRVSPSFQHLQKHAEISQSVDSGVVLSAF